LPRFITEHENNKHKNYWIVSIKIFSRDNKKGHSYGINHRAISLELEHDEYVQGFYFKCGGDT
jgi:hypothetical protein